MPTALRITLKITVIPLNFDDENFEYLGKYTAAVAPIYRGGPLAGNKLCPGFHIEKLTYGQPVWRLLSTWATPINRGGSGDKVAP